MYIYIYIYVTDDNNPYAIYIFFLWDFKPDINQVSFPQCETLDIKN